MSTEEILRLLQDYGPLIGGVLATVFGVVALAISNRINGFARDTVGAVYRVAIRAAGELQDNGIEWLRSEEGVSYRKGLAKLAYEKLPEHVGPLPTGLVRKFITEEQFERIVEDAFQQVVVLAQKLELPPDLPESQA